MYNGQVKRFQKVWPKFQYFPFCEAEDHVMVDQSDFQGYKTFPLGLSIAVIQFYRFMLCGS